MIGLGSDKNMLNMAGRFISPLVLNLTVSPLTSQLNTKLFSSHQSVNIFYIREEKSNMRWKLIVVLQSIFIIHYFDLNPIWPSFLERIWEPEGVRLGFQFFLEMTCLEVIYHIQKDSWCLDAENPLKKCLTFETFVLLRGIWPGIPPNFIFFSETR